MQVYYLVDSNSSGTPDLSGKLLSGIDTPNGVAVQGSSLYVSGFEDGKGMIWRLDDVHEYALQNKVSTALPRLSQQPAPPAGRENCQHMRRRGSGWRPHHPASIPTLKQHSNPKS